MSPLVRRSRASSPKYLKCFLLHRNDLSH
jgi:hypothetical protein